MMLCLLIYLSLGTVLTLAFDLLLRCIEKRSWPIGFQLLMILIWPVIVVAFVIGLVRSTRKNDEE